MKKFYIFLALAITSQLYAQNKTLGVGTASPNANAALHVESPTGNQGLLMPRLTTAQRTAMAALPLTSTDIGLMVYDTSLKALFIWNGTQWQSSAKLALPYVDTVLSAPNGSNLLRLLYTGSGATENVGVAQFENMNPNNGFSALFARTNSITNGAADLVVNNTANTNDAIGVTTNGLGTAGRFVVNNAANANAAIYASTNGTGGVTSAAIYAETATAFSAITARVTGGTSNAISGISNSTDAGSYAVLGQNNGPGPGGFFFSKSGTGLSGTTQSNVGGALAPVGVYGESTGTGSSASAFRINNATNDFSAVFGETNGTGPVFFGNQIGTGEAGIFKITNAANNSIAVESTTAGQGSAGVFAQTNTGVWSPALIGRTDGQGAAISGISTAVSTNANASEFIVNNAANPRNAVFATTAGTGAAIQAQTATGMTAIHGKRDGASNGNAGLFEITNAANAYATVYVTNAGSGVGVQADVSGTGAAGNFTVSNAASSSSVLYSSTNGTGTVLHVNHNGASGNVAVFQSSNASVARIDKTGKGFFNGGTQSSGADVAEAFEVEGAIGQYEPGDVLVISDKTDRTVEKSSSPNSRKVAGVYATKPGVLLTEKGIEDHLDNTVPMGVVGVIPTKVCLENGAIKRGDLLVSSSQTGKAMKAVPALINGIEIYPQGAIIGKALENFDGTGKALINVLVNVK